jgi:hypothetical protein
MLLNERLLPQVQGRFQPQLVELRRRPQVPVSVLERELV